MRSFSLHIDDKSNVLKFQQLVDAVADAISRKQLHQGDMLPSVNYIMKETGLSRDTVFKAYAELKKRGLVESVPNRGYFVSRQITRVFLFLDTFKAYKEVLYHSFVNHLPKNISVDLHFHHYNIGVFEKTIDESLGKYSKYIVMNFDHPKVPAVTGRIPAKQLLVIDWKIHAAANTSVLYQDFGPAVYYCLEKHLDTLKKYQELVFYYPPFTYHPKDSVHYFQQFCKDNRLASKIVYDSNDFDIKKGKLYLLVSDRTLAHFLDQCAEKQLEPGKSVGVISYNETPMKKYVKNGITVISTNFGLMGQKAAEFVATGKAMNFKVHTNLTVRSSV